MKLKAIIDVLVESGVIEEEKIRTFFLTSKIESLKEMRASIEPEIRKRRTQERIAIVGADGRPMKLH